MKDFICGFYCASVLALGSLLWMAHIRLLGMILILSGWFVGVVVVGHFHNVKRRDRA